MLKTRGDMVAKGSRFGDGFVLNGSSLQLKTSNSLQFAEAAAAIRIRSFEVSVNTLRFTQDGGSWCLFWGTCLGTCLVGRHMLVHMISSVLGHMYPSTCLSDHF